MSTKKIELIEPHEHAGREYPAGSELTPNTADADWLIALKKAKPASPVRPEPVEGLPGKNPKSEFTKENAA